MRKRIVAVSALLAALAVGLALSPQAASAAPADAGPAIEAPAVDATVDDSGVSLESTSSVKKHGPTMLPMGRYWG